MRRDKSWLPQAQGKAVKIVAQLLPHLPREFFYRIIFIHRDLREVLASQLVMLDRLQRPGSILEADRLAYALEQHVNQVLEWLQSQNNAQVLHLDYSTILKDPDTAIARLSTFLGPSLKLAAMKSAVDPSLRHQKTS